MPIGQDAFLGLSTTRNMNMQAEQMRQAGIYEQMMQRQRQQDEMTKLQEQYKFMRQNALDLEAARGTNKEALADIKLLASNKKDRANRLMQAADQLEGQARAMAQWDPERSVAAMNEARKIREQAINMEDDATKKSYTPPVPTPTQQKPVGPSPMLSVGGETIAQATQNIATKPTQQESAPSGVSPVWQRAVENRAIKGLVSKSATQKAMELGYGSNPDQWGPEQMMKINDAMQADKIEVAQAAAKVGVEAAKEKEMIDRRTTALKSLKDTESAINIVENIKSKSAGLFTSTSALGASGQYWGTKVQEWTHMMPKEKQEYVSYIKSQAPALIKGLGSASGVLSDQDINYGLQTAPQFGDQKEVASAKIASLEKALTIAANGVKRMATANPDQVPEIIAQTKLDYYAALDGSASETQDPDWPAYKAKYPNATPEDLKEAKRKAGVR